MNTRVPSKNYIQQIDIYRQTVMPSQLLGGEEKRLLYPACWFIIIINRVFRARIACAQPLIVIRPIAIMWKPQAIM